MFPILARRPLAIALSCLSCTVAMADDAPAETDATALKAVNVVATKTSGFAARRVEVGPYQGQDILDIAATVNVVTRDLLDVQAPTGLYDALRNVPGVARQQLNGLAYDNIAIRGIPLDNRSSYYFNGVLPFDNNITIPMEDKQGFEVLKGASALYYGFAVPGGIVNMTSKRAGATPVTQIGTSVDSNGSVKGTVDIARRFGAEQQFGVRVNAASQHVMSPIDKDNGYRRMGSLAADWKVSDALLLKYDYEHVEQKLPEQAGITPLAAVGGQISLPRLPDADKLLSPDAYPTKATANTQLLRADFAITDQWAGMVSIGQSTTRRDRWLWIIRNYNLATGVGQLQGSKQNGQSYENTNGRAEINGSFDTGPITHNVTVGFSRNRLFQPDFTTYYFVSPQSLYDPTQELTLKASGTPKVFYAQTIWTTGTYAFDRFSVGDHLEFTAGLRRSSYKSNQLGTPSYDTSKNTPSASAVYKIDSRSSVYASYIEGLESAGSAPATAANAYQALPAAVSRQAELGYRHRFENETLVSVAAFDIRQPAANLDADNVYALNGRARFRGVEASAQGYVLPRLSIAASAVWLHARQDESTEADLIGTIPENTPRTTASLFAMYDIARIPGFSVNAGAFYTAARPINNLDQAWIGGYTLFTAGSRYRTTVAGKDVTVQLNIENLGNKRYWSAAGSSQLAVGLGRTASLSSTIDF
jgi:iron complex outermembrane receptor protein